MALLDLMLLHCLVESHEALSSHCFCDNDLFEPSSISVVVVAASDETQGIRGANPLQHKDYGEVCQLSCLSR